MTDARILGDWLASVRDRLHAGERPDTVPGPDSGDRCDVTYASDPHGRRFAVIGYQLPPGVFLASTINPNSPEELAGFAVYIPDAVPTVDELWQRLQTQQAGSPAAPLLTVAELTSESLLAAAQQMREIGHNTVAATVALLAAAVNVPPTDPLHRGMIEAVAAALPAP